MFADSKIPIRVTNPGQVEVILKPEGKIEVSPALQLVEDHAVIDPLDRRLGSVVIVKQLTVTPPDFGDANRMNPQQSFRCHKIDPGFLFFRLNLKQDNVLWLRMSDNRPTQDFDVAVVVDPAK